MHNEVLCSSDGEQRSDHSQVDCLRVALCRCFADELNHLECKATWFWCFSGLLRCRGDMQLCTYEACISKLLDYVAGKSTPEGAYLSNSGVIALSSTRGAFSLQVCVSNLQTLNCLHIVTVWLSQKLYFGLPVCANMQGLAPPDEGGSAHMPV